ncbi:MAG: M64 family metallo-endopeptidase [Myxococcales bacterium]|nr:M64 family metallo-endopeptidase [Myxococcales bacterium]
MIFLTGQAGQVRSSVMRICGVWQRVAALGVACALATGCGGTVDDTGTGTAAVDPIPTPAAGDTPATGPMMDAITGDDGPPAQGTSAPGGDVPGADPIEPPPIDPPAGDSEDTPVAGMGGTLVGEDQPGSDFVLDCGPDGIALESAGPPENRINYIIVGDAYDEADLDTTYVEHLQRMLDDRFTPEREPYLRYRRFVNICALRVPSVQSGVGTEPGNTAFDGYGNDGTRLGYINDSKVNAAIRERLPAEIEVDWTAVVLNGDRWWNSGGRIMVWSGGNPDAPGAAMHEGGHSFQRLADEYGGNCTFSGDESRMRVNVTMDAVDTAGKWSHWLDFVQEPGTGLQATFEGAQYCDRGAWRPSQESVMNSLWRSPSFNSISLEQAVRIIYEIVEPFDVALSTPQGATTEQVLEARVVDPDVLQVDWSVDGELVAEDHGYRLDLTQLELASGEHTVTARAHDDTEWVRGDRAELEQTLEWTVQIP